MAAKTKPSKRDVILDAMLDIAVEHGFHDAPMSLVAQRSGASAGVIYHYFRARSHHPSPIRAHPGSRAPPAPEGFSLEQHPRDTFIQGWLNTYTFYCKYKREMRFYEQYAHAGFTCAPESVQTDERAAFFHRFSSQSKGGVLNEWPPMSSMNSP